MLTCKKGYKKSFSHSKQDVLFKAVIRAGGDMENHIDRYIQDSPELSQAFLLKVREIALGIDPGLEQHISYGIPTLKKNGKIILHFAAQKGHLGLYPGTDAIVHFENRLRNHNTRKGTIQISYLEPLDQKLVADLIRFNLERATAD